MVGFERVPEGGLPGNGLPGGWTAWRVDCLEDTLISASQFKAFHGI